MIVTKDELRSVPLVGAPVTAPASGATDSAVEPSSPPAVALARPQDPRPSPGPAARALQEARAS